MHLENRARNGSGHIWTKNRIFTSKPSRESSVENHPEKTGKKVTTLSPKKKLALSSDFNAEGSQNLRKFDFNAEGSQNRRKFDFNAEGSQIRRKPEFLFYSFVVSQQGA